MAVLFVTEYAQVVDGVGVEPALAEQTVAIGAGSVQSAELNAGTHFVRLHTDAICSVKFGQNPTATATTARMAANETRMHAVKPNLAAGSRNKVAVITNT